MSTATPGAPFRWRDFAAVLWDLDGVLTATAALHERAWAEVFAGFGFGPEDYRLHVDGRPRIDGVRGFLAARGVTLPEGDPTDGPEAGTVYGYARRKNRILTAILDREGIVVYPDAAEMVARCTDWGLAQAVVSSSRNARAVLDAAGLSPAFGVVVDGVLAAERRLAGKPAPDMFVVAAAALGVDPARCVVVEDAVAGVRAARAAGVGLVIGVTRGGSDPAGTDHGAQRDALIAAGADTVVGDLREAAR